MYSQAGGKTMSGHEAYISKVGAFHHIFRPKGDRFEVLKYTRLAYTAANVTVLCDAIRRSLSMDLISHQVRRAYPDGHPAWQRDLFGYCVPASFALLYFLDTDALAPFRGVDPAGADLVPRERRGCAFWFLCRFSCDLRNYKGVSRRFCI